MTKDKVPANPNGICFIGALNHDLVCLDRMTPDIREYILRTRLGKEIEFSETAISDCENAEVIKKLNSATYRSQLGGAAFNAARSAALIGSFLRLGIVGVAGQIDGAYPHHDSLLKMNVDVSFLRLEDAPCACSISFSHEGDRTLLTARGANVCAGEFFKTSRTSLVDYLASFSKIHITSFLDEDTTESLGELLKSALDHQRILRISVDPGAYWVNNLSKAVKVVLSTASVLHLNEREFADLGGKLKGENESSVAERISGMMREGRKTIVLRKHKSVRIFEITADSIHSIFIENRRILSDREVIDATGAGDSFTGLLLAAEEAQIITTSLAASFAIPATVAKLKHPGPIDQQDIQIALALNFGPTEVTHSWRSFYSEGNGNEG